MKNNIRKIETIRDFHTMRGLSSPQHPLISLIDYVDTDILPEHIGEQWHFNFYSIGVKRNVGTLRYGQQNYDFDEGLMSFIAPGQLLHIKPNSRANKKPSGWLLLIHPDFIWKSTLAKTIHQYEFFNYAINEALFMSPKEETLINGIFSNIKNEIESTIDSFSQNILIAQIELLLQYSERFYQRQFITREKKNHEVLGRLEDVLTELLNSKNTTNKGLPSVKEIADLLHLTPNYLSSLLKSLTGKNTQQFIHEKLIEKAKEKLATTNLSITEIAYEFGFEHSQSFSKLFKSKTNISPSEFRSKFHA
ncbi:AraC family transcriptional regulator [Wenyingzhuangia sp. 2_MG-2023]|uniref:helix-turn-helix domain-containing protein n=1 Tax=Wenyingzhuangia sp. 2_MG-2023 TaxID=3062639 RepID=UPI0026E26A04|nr:helix-turn-helix transcriptional regulator [Wenyingzhuangia sp. 2_MG-2023]MDO6736730.1 helix-turn-helix transcriptional regulator [Wenyingzhuangia sp. 2_MG-2023]